LKTRPGISGKLAGILMLAAMAGCRHVPESQPSGQSGFRFVQPPPAAPSTGKANVALEPVQRSGFREARLIDPVILPVYPARALAAKAGAATVGVHITVDEQGIITDIRSSIWVVSLPGPFREDFRAAVDAALSHWRFVPAEILEFERSGPDGDAPVRVTKREKVVTELELAFDFAPGGGTARAR